MPVEKRMTGSRAGHRGHVPPGSARVPAGDFETKNVAIFGVQIAQSLVTALMAASLMLLAGLALVRAVRTWAQSAGRGWGVRVALEPVLVGAGEIASLVRPSAGVAACAPTRAPPPVAPAAGGRLVQGSAGRLGPAE